MHPAGARGGGGGRHSRGLQPQARLRLHISRSSHCKVHWAV